MNVKGLTIDTLATLSGDYDKPTYGRMTLRVGDRDVTLSLDQSHIDAIVDAAGLVGDAIMSELSRKAA